MAWLLILILGLPLLVQPATTHGSNSTQPSDQNDLSSQGMNHFQQTHPISRPLNWIEERVDNRLYRDLLLPIRSNFAINEGSGEGSGLQQSIEVMMPSGGRLEMDTFISGRAEKLDFEDIEGPTPPVPQRLTQHIVNDDDDRDVILANTNTDLYQATSTMPIQLTTHTHTTFIYDNERINKDQPLLTTNKLIRENNTTVKSSTINMHVQRFTTDTKLDHSTSLKDLQITKNEDVKSFQETRYASSTQTLSSITKPETLGNNGTIVMQSKSFDNLSVKEERYVTNHAPTATPPFETGQERGKETTSDLQIPTELPLTNPSVIQAKTHTDKTKKQDEKPKWFGGLFGPLTDSDLSGTIASCIPGPCVVSTNSNITRLQWADLKRTLTFAWDLHVYGSAILFSLVVAIATFGIIGGTHMLHPFCRAFILANILLLLAGLLRLVLFLVDPYGTRNIIPRPTLTALYNLPVTFLLWAQATLALFSLRQERLSLQTSPQQLSLTGGLVAMHCTSILIADLLSETLSPALPLMLQTLTVCWGLPLCLGIFFQSLKQLYPSHRTPLPRWSASMRVVNNVRRVLLLCGLLGVLSCALQIYGFMWLYGLLGNWQRFGWGWWVVQLCARLLELAWSFSLLLLGSRVFWRPRGAHGTAEQRKGSTRGAQKEMSQFNRTLKSLPMGPWGRPDRNWAELLPNNWKGQRQSRGNVSHSTNKNQASPAALVTTVHDNTGITDGGVQYKSGNDCHATPLWTSGVEWQEHECFLSLVEFDHCPPSHVNLSHSMDSALHHAHLLGVGTIFAPSPPSWDQTEGPFESYIRSPISTNRAYRWTLDPCSSPVPTHHFGIAVQQAQVSVIEPLEYLTPETIRKVWERDTAIPRITGDDDLTSIASGDDVTSL